MRVFGIRESWRCPRYFAAKGTKSRNEIKPPRLPETGNRLCKYSCHVSRRTGLTRDISFCIDTFPLIHLFIYSLPEGVNDVLSLRRARGGRRGERGEGRRE